MTKHIGPTLAAAQNSNVPERHAEAYIAPLRFFSGFPNGVEVYALKGEVE